MCVRQVTVPDNVHMNHEVITELIDTRLEGKQCRHLTDHAFKQAAMLPFAPMSLIGMGEISLQRP